MSPRTKIPSRRRSRRPPAAPLLALPLAFLLALLAPSPRALAGCCDGAGPGGDGTFAYGTNTFSVANCAGLAWLEPQHDVAGEDGCGCEEAHSPNVGITCCDEDISVEWTKECFPGEDASVTVFTGRILIDGAEAGTVSLSGRVLRPQGGCGSAGCGGSDAQAHGAAVAAKPFVDERLSLGPSSGFLRLLAATPTNSLATPAALELVRGTKPVDLVCAGTPPAPRQVYSSSGLADIYAEGAAAYRIDFYHTADVYPELATNGVNEGLYVVRPGRSPHASWRVSSSDGGTNVTVAGGPAGAVPRTNAYAYAEAPGAYGPTRSWTLASGGVEETLSVTAAAAPGTEVRAFSRGPAGQPRTAYRAETWFAPSNGVRALLARVEDPEGLALATRWTHATNNPARPRLLFTEHPDGSWELPGYDALGRVATLRTPLGNAWTNAPDSALSIVSNAYASVDALDTGGWEWSDKPRTVSTHEAGVLVSRTYHAYYRTAGGERVEIVERAATPTAAYGDPANLRTKRTWFAESASEPWSDEPRFVESPGGLLETFAYEAGVLDASDPDPALWTFTPDATGSWVRATATHGTAESPDGVPGRTLRETSVRDAFGRALLEETWACSGPTNYARVAWTATTRDELGRATSVVRSDGTVSETVWGCCGPESETGPDGVRHEYAYDALGRRVLAFREGLPGLSADRYEATAYDVHGRVLSTSVTADGLSTSVTADGLSQTATNAYDAAGRPVWTRGPDGVETATAYGSNSTATVRGGYGQAPVPVPAATNLAVRFADGRPHYTELNGVRKATYAYGANADGTRWTTVHEGPSGDASPAWTKTTADFLGRTLIEERPAFGGGTLVSSNAYESGTGRLLSTTQSHNPNPGNPVILSTTLFSYDFLGDLVLTAQDLDLDGETDLAGPDRVAGQSVQYWYGDPGAPGRSLGEGWWRESASWTYPGDGSSAPFTNSVARTRLTGLGAPYAAPPPGVPSGDWLLASESVSLDALGNATVGRALLDRAARRTLQFTDTPASTLDAWTLAVDGLSVTNATATGVASSHAYDALGRRSTTTDGRGNATAYEYDAFGRLASESRANGASPPFVTTYGYDALGRRTSATDPLDQTTHTAYDPEGRVAATWGATYPVAYEYDAHGRMSAMATTRDPALDFAPLAAHLASGQSLESFASLGSLDRTQWLYHEPTGLLTNKVYADGKGTVYSYTPDGKLSTRTWARGVATTYAYTNGSSLAAISYSDATPAVAFAYDRLGRQVSAIVEGVSTNLYAYDALSLTNETVSLCASAPLRETITRATDALGRPSGFSLDGTYAVAYGYDAYGRFQSVTSAQSADTNTWTYSYLPGSHLLSGHTSSFGLHTSSFSRSFEPHRDLVTSVENTFGETVISRYDYGNDAIGRRAAIGRSGTAFGGMPVEDTYGYNARSEVTSARRALADDPNQEVRGFSYDYAYDPLGNRTTSTEYDSGNNALVSSYSANQLNQYGQRTVPGYAAVRGEAATNATVTVNANPVWRLGEYFHGGDTADNSASAVMKDLAIVAVINPPGTNDPDQVSAVTGRVFVAQTPESFQYDDDGNLTRDGRFNYTWNAENRLVAVTTRDDLPAAVPRVRVEYAYDHRGRMVWKAVAPSNSPPTKATAYVWDGYNIVAEHVVSDVGTNVTYNVWGLDLSGSLQGAGGVGGLLAVVKDAATYTPSYDANGNITEYLATNRMVAAHYEYDPFGNTVVQSGDLADFFTHRFSTKPWCPVTGLSEYLFRKYGPRFGRWLSRDPIGEAGGENLFRFAQNSPLLLADALGLSAAVPYIRNPDLKFRLDRSFRPIGHPDLQGAYGLTPYASVVDAEPKRRVVKVNECCARVERSDASLLLVKQVLPDSTEIGLHVTARGWSEILDHEDKRAKVYVKGLHAYYGPVSGVGSAALRCGVVCRKAGYREAAAALDVYLSEQRYHAFQQYFDYAKSAQAVISRENGPNLNKVVVNGRELIDGRKQIYTPDDPPPFDDSRADCPPSDF